MTQHGTQPDGQTELKSFFFFFSFRTSPFPPFSRKIFLNRDFYSLGFVDCYLPSIFQPLCSLHKGGGTFVFSSSTFRTGHGVLGVVPHLLLFSDTRASLFSLCLFSPFSPSSHVACIIAALDEANRMENGAATAHVQL